MALHAIGARLEGDNYQHRFFWYQAAQLLVPTSLVTRVVLECDAAGGMDDVAVFYGSPGVVAGLQRIDADYFQIKYHVDQRDAYASERLLARADEGKRSLLGRIADAYRAVKAQHANYRLNLLSNWGWATDDPLRDQIYDLDGALRAGLLTAGPRSALGKLRAEWRSHLAMEEDEFADFARRLRLVLNYLSRAGLGEALADRLALAGLVPIDRTLSTSRYDDLAQKLVMNGKNDFTSESFKALCKQEGLLAEAPTPRAPRVGIRSFLRAAENIEAETDGFVCVAKHFDGRAPIAADSWITSVRPEVTAFLTTQTPALRKAAHEILLDCHQSLAMLAGYELDTKGGAVAFPIQKGPAGAVLWRPSNEPASVADAPWASEIDDEDAGAEDLVLAVSVTRDVVADVATFRAAAPLRARVLVRVAPTGGIGPRSVRDADHAVALADALQTILFDTRKRLGIRGRLHLFAAAPNALLFFFGQRARALGPITLYEFDFEGTRGGSYAKSLELP